MSSCIDQIFYDKEDIKFFREEYPYIYNMDMSALLQNKNDVIRFLKIDIELFGYSQEDLVSTPNGITIPRGCINIPYYVKLEQLLSTLENREPAKMPTIV